MATLIYRTDDGPLQELTFRGDLRLGADAHNNLVLPGRLGVAPEHALITRSALNRVPVLIDLVGEGTWVEGRRVIGLQVLRHGARLRLGQVEFTMLELRIIRLRRGDHAVGRPCKVCFEVQRPGAEVVICPNNCGSMICRACWTYTTICPDYICGYPMHTAVMDALATHLRFERSIAEDSPLVERMNSRGIVINQGMRCKAGEPRDQVKFQPSEHAAFCPSCDLPFHLECWLRLSHCPVCRFDVQQLIDTVFLSEHVESEGLPA